MEIQTNWWEHFFEGVAVTMWLQALTVEQTAREADRLERLLNATRGAHILDVPCGAGRLALALADRDYRLTGVDSSAAFIAHAESRDTLHRVRWERRDMRDLPWPGEYDAAFCAGNSFGYMDDEGNAAFLQAVRAALKPGGRFVLETPMVLENLLNHLQPRAWWKAGDVYLLVENAYDAARSRLDIEYTFVSDGQIEVRRGSHRAYPCKELIELLSTSGFEVELAEGWSRDAPVVSFIATRA